MPSPSPDTQYGQRVLAAALDTAGRAAAGRAAAGCATAGCATAGCATKVL